MLWPPHIDVMAEGKDLIFCIHQKVYIHTFHTSIAGGPCKNYAVVKLVSKSQGVSGLLLRSLYGKYKHVYIQCQYHCLRLSTGVPHTSVTQNWKQKSERTTAHGWSSQHQRHNFRGIKFAALMEGWGSNQNYGTISHIGIRGWVTWPTLKFWDFLVLP